MIILGISMFVFLYFLYKFLLGNPVVKSINLRYDNTIVPYYYSTLNVPNGTRYSYYIWVHANMIDTKNEQKENIFKVVSDNANTNELFSLDITKNTNLEVTILTNDTPTKLKKTFLITPNFPMQSWQQIIISFDNINMDAYLNGKFVKSVQFNTNTLKLPVQTTTDTQINFGVPSTDTKLKPDIDIRLFERYDYAMDPQTAWNKFRSDQNVNDGTSTNYGLKLNLSTNNKIRSIPIF